MTKCRNAVIRIGTPIERKMLNCEATKHSAFRCQPDTVCQLLVDDSYNSKKGTILTEYLGLLPSVNNALVLLTNEQILWDETISMMCGG